MLTGNVYRRCVGTCLDVQGQAAQEEVHGQGHRCGIFRSRRLSGRL